MKNRYVIYNCIAVRSDKTKIIRIIKIQSHFQVEDLAIALITTSDSPGIIKEIEFENDGCGYTFDDSNPIYDGISFDELEETNVKVTLVYEDNTKIKYSCVQVGEEITRNKITRTTPIILAAMGMSRFTHAEYIINHKKEVEKYKTLNLDPNYDGYYAAEDFKVSCAMNDLQRFFNMYKDDYYA